MEPGRRELVRAMRIVYGGALLNGPFSIVVGHSKGIMALCDRIKLRPMVAARKGDMLYVASEEAGIREVCRNPDTLWHAEGGVPIVGQLRASNRMPREPRCASGRMDARKGDDAVPGSGTVRNPDAADAGLRRNPEGRGVFGCMPVSRRLGASDSLCAVAHAPWPAAKSTPSRPRVILLEALRSGAPPKARFPMALAPSST
jgi:hypothetical protein